MFFEIRCKAFNCGSKPRYIEWILRLFSSSTTKYPEKGNPNPTRRCYCSQVIPYSSLIAYVGGVFVLLHLYDKTPKAASPPVNPQIGRCPFPIKRQEYNGETFITNLSRHCLPMQPDKDFEITDHFLQPYFSTSLIR